MSIGTAGFHKSLAEAWTSFGLNDLFRSYWSPEQKDFFPSLHDSEATPGQPFPYCVFVLQPGDVETRMSGVEWNEKRNLRTIPGEFNIHAEQVSTHSAKELAALLAESIMAKFGGHPTELPETFPDLDCGKLYLVQYQNDYGIRTGDSEYQWVIEYLFKLDVPVRIE